MKNKFLFIGTIAVAVTLSIISCKKNNDNNNNSNKVTGYLYTTTNGESTNQVVRFSRMSDGSLTEEKSFTTNSNGGANVAAGGDAHGDFDAQGAVQIIGNYLLNVNAGGNQVSVFSLDRKNGDLALRNNVSSGGTRPVSIAYLKKTGSADEYWVVVGNQWNNPNIQKDGANIQRYPNNAFYQQDLTLADATDNERNITLFTFNTTSGALTLVKQLDKYVRQNGGPTTVSFSADGTKLAVSTWGIAHFDTQVTSLAEQRPSRVYVYNFTNGDISGKRYFEEAGISGTIGFNWDKIGSSKLYVSNFNLIPTKRDNSVTVLNDNGTLVSKSANFSATAASAINESCWTALNISGDKLYVASFQTNLVSTFGVSGGNLTFGSTEARADLAPHGDSKELWLSPDNKYLYNLGALQSFSINIFDVNGAGTKYRSQTVLSTTASGKGIAGKYNFLGLTGFDF
ncbi:lactonase family protein [Mucilaginibacter gilvus]|nr:beta-propeller fold lactonase family protein [Mucilaginibacter gilvus]